ncbi:activating transcription factor 7-interacting protein 1-like isoform X2 [Artemia franciscana]|uniref:activating transcription factor 7-interacting protein 1-like isoform X2 n=1 Tax=Artemia franciscana TaxID=6661 RepID=UPI0032DB1723
MVQCDLDNGIKNILSGGKNNSKDGIFSNGEQSTSNESLSLDSSPISSQKQDQGEPKESNSQSDSTSDLNKNGQMDLGVSLPSSNMADVALAMLEKEALENKTAKGDTTPSSKLVNAPCSENQKLESFVRTISRQRLEYLVMRYLVRHIKDQSYINELRREVQEGRNMIMTLASKIKMYCQHGRELKTRQDNAHALKTSMHLPTSERLCRDASTQINPVDKDADKSQANNSANLVSNKRRNSRPEVNRLQKRSRSSSVLKNATNGVASTPTTARPSPEQNSQTVQRPNKSPIKNPKKASRGSPLAPATPSRALGALPTDTVGAAKPSDFLPMNVIPSDVLVQASKKSLSSENNVNGNTQLRRPEGEIVTKVATVKWPEGTNIPQGLTNLAAAQATEKQAPNVDGNQNANVIDLTDDDASSGSSGPVASTSFPKISSSSSSSSGKLLAIVSIAPPSVGEASATGSSDSKSVQYSLSIRRHPGPLPQLQAVSDSGVSCPFSPEPVIQLSKRDTNICVRLDLPDRSFLSKIKDYFIYEYHAKDCPPSSDHWRCIDRIEACTPPVEIVLTNIDPDLRYYIAVVARDRLGRFGPYSIVNYIDM